MDPFTLALATFGVQKLRGKSTKRALRDAAIVGTGSYAIGAMGGGAGMGIGQGAPFSGVQSALGFGQQTGSTFAQQRAVSDIPSYAIRGGGAVMATVRAAAPTLPKTGGITSNLLTKFKETKPGTKIALGAALLPLLQGDEEPVEPPFDEGDYRRAYAEQSAKLQGAFVPTENARPTRDQTYGSNMFYANEGGLANMVSKFNQGGINYLPSKSDHDENDINNYVKAEGYVEDGAGNGDKDEDTMLAQLADGEFVSRADAVLGAGILSGADPKSYKSMRKAGADFFYDQQKKLKRIYDLVDANKTEK